MEDKHVFKFWKLGLSIVIDLLDLIMPPGFEEVLDLAGVGLSYYMYGPIGLTTIWEVVDVTSVADRFSPSLTIVSLIMLFMTNKNCKKIKGKMRCKNEKK